MAPATIKLRAHSGGRAAENDGGRWTRSVVGSQPAEALGWDESLGAHKRSGPPLFPLILFLKPASLFPISAMRTMPLTLPGRCLSVELGTPCSDQPPLHNIDADANNGAPRESPTAKVSTCTSLGVTG